MNGSYMTAFACLGFIVEFVNNNKKGRISELYPEIKGS